MYAMYKREIDNKKDKFVVAATGTNLYFGIYSDKNGKRFYETIPLNIVIERLKQNEYPIIEEKLDENGEIQKLIFFLNPNDLVYVPTLEQIESGIKLKQEDLIHSRIYRFIDSSDTTANFNPASSATTILNINKKEQEKRGLAFTIQNEYGIGSPQSKNQNSIEGVQIKSVCIKLNIDRLGQITAIDEKPF